MIQGKPQSNKIDNFRLKIDVDMGSRFELFEVYSGLPKARLEPQASLLIGDCHNRWTTNPHFHVNCNSSMIGTPRIQLFLSLGFVG